MPDYAARIRAARSFAGLTQQQLADRLGVDVQTVKRREAPTGHEQRQDPKKGERIAIATICGVPEDFLEAGFGGGAETEVSSRLEELEDQIRLLRAELAARDAEVLQRLDSALPPNEDAQLGPQQ